MNEVSGMVLFSPLLQSLKSASIFVNPIISFSPASRMSVKTWETLSVHDEVFTSSYTRTTEVTYFNSS